MKQNWISIFGNVKIEDGLITHLPVPLQSTVRMPTADSTTEPPPPHAIIRSNLEFEQGTITWEAYLGDPDCRVQVILAADNSAASASDVSKGDSQNLELNAGLNVLGTPYGFALWNGAWEGLGGAGLGSTLPVGQWIPLKLTVRGSFIELYVNGIKVVATTRTLKRCQIGALLQGHNSCAIRNVSVTKDSPMCFAVMQFTEDFNIKDVIHPVCESYGYKVIRGDDFYTSGQIMEDVTQSIRSAALIIADVTPDNANVFYEVGYAHAIGKPTILLSDRKRERLPFDISGFRTLFYDNTIGGKAVVEERLKQHLDALR